MKKTKLLIPALSIASVGAVVAPMVTSCAQVNNAIGYQFYKDGKKADDYKAKFEAKKAGTAFERGIDPLSEATLAYFKDVRENPTILADDVFVAINTLLPMSSSEYTNFKLDVFDIAFDTRRLAGEDITLLSAEINLYLEKSVNGDTMKEDIHFSLGNIIPSIRFSTNDDKPAIIFNLDATAVFSIINFSTVGVSYKCIDKNDKVLYDIYAQATDPASIQLIWQGLKQASDQFDDAINALITILTARATEADYPSALKSAYFANQTQKAA